MAKPRSPQTTRSVGLLGEQDFPWVTIAEEGARAPHQGNLERLFENTETECPSLSGTGEPPVLIAAGLCFSAPFSSHPRSKVFAAWGTRELAGRPAAFVCTSGVSVLGQSSRNPLCPCPLAQVASGTLQKERDEVPRAALRSQRDDALTFHRYVSARVRSRAPFLLAWWDGACMCWRRPAQLSLTAVNWHASCGY